ncbi:MAG TPA: tRNA pseudouridine(55) synthase TruB [Acidobacteriota bacterium]
MAEREQGKIPCGILLVDKPRGPTSHDVVARLRRDLPRGARVGHTGTLDPIATGLLVLCIGPATRLARFLAGLDKEYSATVRLGVETDTFDAEGKVVAARSVPALSRSGLELILADLTGERSMTPPPFSAKKRGGERLYKAARQGRAIAVEPVLVRIASIELGTVTAPDLEIRVRCSAGTYVRALAQELGQRLGCGAHLSELRRTSVGAFQLADAAPLERLEQAARAGELASYLIPPAAALPALPLLSLSQEELQRVRHGGDLIGAQRLALSNGSLIRLVDGAGELVAVAECRPGAPARPILHPVVVLPLLQSEG